MNMKEFLTKFAADQALGEKMSKATSPEEAYAIAKEAGLTDTLENFTATMKKLNDASGDMSTKELDEITGGANTSEIVATVTVSTSISGIVISANVAASV